MQRRTYLAAVGTSLLAGCSSGSDSSTTETDTDTSTPTETPTDTPTATPEPTLEDVSFPDGVTGDDVSADVVTSHQRQLLGEQYTIEMESVEGSRLTQTTVEIGSNSIHQEQVSSNTSNRSFYKNGDIGFASANDGEFHFTVDPTVNRDAVSQIRRLRRHIEAGNYTPTDAVEQNGSLLIRAEADDASLTERFRRRAIDTIDSYSGTVLLTEDGRIVDLKYDMTFSRNDRSTDTEFSFATKAVGSTSVSEPSWLSTARADAVTFTARPAGGDDPKYVAIDIEGDGSLPSNISGSLSFADGSAFGQTSSTISGGDTLYLAATPENRLTVSVNTQPSNVANIDGRTFVNVNLNGVAVVNQSLSL
ncbi:hypothetical protein EGH21_20415 [Halomicroarcula sp. F13]|uniref:Uncharacterized protein n=1 Tax=Haloarcula rubra TaxID=2487747 RepID=A0AAW4PY10_9EURY|nr:hypothetical protein [Halomicroarcula rubra]MBX0325395.1 hypothetical protein [Halomicroarcula rubra]